MCARSLNMPRKMRASICCTNIFTSLSLRVYVTTAMAHLEEEEERALEEAARAIAECASSADVGGTSTQVEKFGHEEINSAAGSAETIPSVYEGGGMESAVSSSRLS